MAEPDARTQAVDRIKRKRDLRQTAFVFVLVWIVLIAIWALTGADFFWPVFPIGGMAIALAFQAWGVYGQKPISEEEIQREMQRSG